MPALSILVWLPALTGVLATLLSWRPWRAHIPPASPPPTWWAQVAPAAGAGSVRDPGQRLAAGLALLGSLATLALSIGYISEYSGPGAGLQHVTDVNWIPELGIHYKLAVSGLNVFLVGMTALVFAAAVLAANLRAWERPRLFYFFFMLAESAVLGALLAQDLALFVAFFDLMLIPFYFLIGGWGREPGRVRATVKLVIYTLVGSLLMLAGAIATGVLAAQHAGGHL
ncbi:MAG TPA: proton-conducting transporter membrane subunit, partial [Solirubrobacteraceae bacterium]|nr:proton-conducting transporter membrane subunit [Solirubrobacteraceae bacterium]